MRLRRWSVRLLCAAVVILVRTALAPLAPAGAEHSCRVEARSLAGQVVRTQNVDEARQRFSGAIEEHPECTAEFQTLAEFYEAEGAQAFPFPPDDDPRHGFLGPVGWWWNTVYIDWFGRSTTMMVLFGWARPWHHRRLLRLRRRPVREDVLERRRRERERKGLANPVLLVAASRVTRRPAQLLAQLLSGPSPRPSMPGMS